MRKSLILLAATALFSNAFAAEPATDEAKTFTPSGKAFAQIYANYNQTYLGDSLVGNELAVERAYFGYGYEMTENWSAKVKLDVGGDDTGVREMFLKEASLSYKKGNLSVNGGLIGLVQHKTQEKYWGHRYVYKSFQDAQKISHSADIGIVADYKICDLVSIDFTVRNGEGYKKVQADKAFKQQIGVTVFPIDMLVVRGFAVYGATSELREFDEFSDMDKAELVYGGFLGAKPIEGLTAGVEYTMQSNAKNHTDDQTSGYSIYTSYDVTEKLEVFGRYDNANWLVNKTVERENEAGEPVLDDAGEVIVDHKEDKSKSNSLIIVGVQYKPYKKIKFSLDYQMQTLESADDKTNGIFVHADIKF